MKGRLGYLPDDEVSITKLEELVQANRRFGYEIEYDVYILPVTAELMEELRSTGQRIAAIFSTEYLKREGLKTGKREVLNVHRWKVESSVPELLMSEGFMYLYKTSMDNELVLGAGQMHFEICQQEFHQNLAPDWKWDRHYGLV